MNFFHHMSEASAHALAMVGKRLALTTDDYDLLIADSNFHTFRFTHFATKINITGEVRGGVVYWPLSSYNHTIPDMGNAPDFAPAFKGHAEWSKTRVHVELGDLPEEHLMGVMVGWLLCL